MAFIPKAGKNSHAKNFRSISLSSFLLKMLKRLMDLHIRDGIPRDMILRVQHDCS